MNACAVAAMKLALTRQQPTSALSQMARRLALGRGTSGDLIGGCDPVIGGSGAPPDEVGPSR